MNEYGVRVRITGRDGRPVTKDKIFKTDKARTAWILKAESKDNFIEVVAYTVEGASA